MNTMSISQIKEMPTVHEKVHESIYRSYQMLSKVRYLIRINTPHEVIEEILCECGYPIDGQDKYEPKK